MLCAVLFANIEMILKINEKISEETVDKLVSFYNGFDPKTGEKALIYFASRGGGYSAMEAMIDLINIYAEHTIIVGYYMLASCGFELFFKVKCKKQFAGGCMGMYHQSCIGVDMNENWKPEYKEDEAKEKYMKGFMKPQTLSLCSELKFTEKELSEIKKGNDVWFQPERMNEFLNVVSS